MVVSTASAPGNPNHGQIMLLRQFVKLLETINQADRARGQALRAIEQAEATHGRLLQLQRHWESLNERASGSADLSPLKAPVPVRRVLPNGLGEEI